MTPGPPDRAIHEADHQAWTNGRFFIQLRRDADLVRGVYRGRVQHVRSGEAAHFESLAELAAFLTEMSVKDPDGNLGGTARGGPAP
jgi:hypothetical protein